MTFETDFEQLSLERYLLGVNGLFIMVDGLIVNRVATLGSSVVNYFHR
jgi:hypothetical protein